MPTKSYFVLKQRNFDSTNIYVFTINTIKFINLLFRPIYHLNVLVCITGVCYYGSNVYYAHFYEDHVLNDILKSNKKYSPVYILPRVISSIEIGTKVKRHLKLCLNIKYQ